MAFPGDRRRKVDITILADAITGALNFDLPVTITHADFVDASKTLDGTLAMKQGGADLAFSLDEAGSTRLALEVVRCELSATPADSRIELKVTVPAESVSDTVDTVIWAWFGSETETQPADDEPYGKHEVWNGPTREGFTPLVTWGAWHFDEDPADPTPQFKDSSGNARGFTRSSGSRVDMSPGRGLSGAGALAGLSSPSWAPGTGDFAIVTALGRYTAWTYYLDFWESTPAQSVEITDTKQLVWVIGSTSRTVAKSAADTSTEALAALVRDGDVAAVYNGPNSSTFSGYSATNFSIKLSPLAPDWSTAGRVSTLLTLNCAPNTYWLRAIYDNILGAGLLGTPQDSQPAAITAYCEFQGLQAGTEVRLYEEPHGQWWSADLDGVTPSALNSKYIAFQIQGSSSSADHYVWFNYNSTGTDPEPGGTGHAVAIATTDTAADVADTLQGVLDALTDLTAAVDGTLVTALNDRNGELAEPTHNSTATVSLIQVGGIATDEIDGIESSTGTTWTATYQILRPRRATVVMLSIAYERVRYSIILTTAGSVQPAGALQREDPNYVNPT